jgi:hypothetical protein
VGQLDPEGAVRVIGDIADSHPTGIQGDDHLGVEAARRAGGHPWAPTPVRSLTLDLAAHLAAVGVRERLSLRRKVDGALQRLSPATQVSDVECGCWLDRE